MGRRRGTGAPGARDRGARLVGHGPARGPPGAGLAVEGKTLRGARTSQGPAPHLLACLDHGSGVVCPQIAVDGKTNGITMLADLPGQITDLNGAVRTDRKSTRLNSSHLGISYA